MNPSGDPLLPFLLAVLDAPVGPGGRMLDYVEVLGGLALWEPALRRQAALELAHRQRLGWAQDPEIVGAALAGGLARVLRDFGRVVGYGGGPRCPGGAPRP